MRRIVPLCLVAVAVCFTPSCKSAEEKEQARAEKEAKRREKEVLAVDVPIPPESPLARVTYGMTEAEVCSLIGAPTSQHGGITGKQFIPFNFAANDTVRIVYRYKGEGTIVFSHGSWGQTAGAVRVKYDPNETGFKPPKD
jgi:hypothetical protein